MPWSRALPVKSTGSGWIYDVDKRIIVTNAHVVEFASTLQVAAAAIHARRCFTGPQVRKEGDAEKYEAQVLVIAYQVLIVPLRH